MVSIQRSKCIANPGGAHAPPPDPPQAAAARPPVLESRAITDGVTYVCSSMCRWYGFSHVAPTLVKTMVHFPDPKSPAMRDPNTW